MCSDLFQILNSVQNIRSFINFWYGMEWYGNLVIGFKAKQVCIICSRS